MLERKLENYLVEAVKAQGADYGIALDGDADRLQLVDANGRLYNGDELLYVMVADRLQQGLRVQGAVGTLMTNMAVELALRSRDVDFVRSKVGDRYVLETLQEKNWILGGEGSGHLLVLDKHSTGDGLVSALQVLQACVRQQMGLSELLKGLRLFPQCLLNVRIKPGLDWAQHAALRQAQADVEHELAGAGRILIRASGTEPVLRIMVEAGDEALAQRCAQKIAASLEDDR